MITFGDKIKQLREASGLPLRRIAAFLDIDQAILSKIEHGQRKAKREQVIRLAEFFHVKTDDLLIYWLSDKIAYELKDEKLATEAIQLAEEKIGYKRPAISDQKAIIEKIQNYLKKDKRVSKAWIFGSFARGEAGPQSDIDLMLEFIKDRSFSLTDFSDIKNNLEKILKRKVDLAEKGYIRPLAWLNIQNDLQLIYE